MWLLRQVFVNGQELQAKPFYGLESIKASDKTIQKLHIEPSIKVKYDKYVY